MKGGGNAWTDHIRDFAKRNNMTYMCALSNPECKAEYKSKKPQKAPKKGKAAEKEQMGMEDIDAPIDKKKQIKFKKSVLAKKVEKEMEKKEAEKMGKEDVNMAEVKPEKQVKKRGRPKKYFTKEDFNKAKHDNTVAAYKRRQEAKRQAKKEAKELKMMAAEDKPKKRGRPKKTGCMYFAPPVVQQPNHIVPLLANHFANLEIGEGGSRTARVADIRHIKFLNDRRNALLKERQRQFDMGHFGGHPSVDSINAELDSIGSLGTAGVPRKATPRRHKTTRGVDKNLVLGSVLDESSGSDWSGEGHDPQKEKNADRRDPAVASPAQLAWEAEQQARRELGNQLIDRYNDIGEQISALEDLRNREDALSPEYLRLGRLLRPLREEQSRIYRQLLEMRFIRDMFGRGRTGGKKAEPIKNLLELHPDAVRNQQGVNAVQAVMRQRRIIMDSIQMVHQMRIELMNMLHLFNAQPQITHLDFNGSMVTRQYAENELHEADEYLNELTQHLQQLNQMVGMGFGANKSSSFSDAPFPRFPAKYSTSFSRSGSLTGGFNPFGDDESNMPDTAAALAKLLSIGASIAAGGLGVAGTVVLIQYLWDKATTFLRMHGWLPPQIIEVLRNNVPADATRAEVELVRRANTTPTTVVPATRLNPDTDVENPITRARPLPERPRAVGISTSSDYGREERENDYPIVEGRGFRGGVLNRKEINDRLLGYTWYKELPNDEKLLVWRTVEGVVESLEGDLKSMGGFAGVVKAVRDVLVASGDIAPPPVVNHDLFSVPSVQVPRLAPQQQAADAITTSKIDDEFDMHLFDDPTGRGRKRRLRRKGGLFGFSNPFVSEPKTPELAPQQQAADEITPEKLADKNSSIGDIFNSVGNKIKEAAEKVGETVKDKIEQVKKTASAVIHGRDDYPPKVRETINKHGDDVIKSITLGRTPLPSPLMAALQVASGNTFKQKLSQTPYDKLFHLFACIEFENGSKIVLEKNEVINTENGCSMPAGTETKVISNIPSGLTLAEALNNTRARMGGKFFGYSAKDNNCQDFLSAFLQANNLGNSADISWVKQETKSLFEGNNRLRKISNTLTDIGARFDVLKQGAGIDFEDMKWGSFTKQFHAYKSQHPKSRVKDLHAFAKLVLKSPKDFKPTTLKRARFYLNVLEKKGGAYLINGKWQPESADEYQGKDGKIYNWKTGMVVGGAELYGYSKNVKQTPPPVGGLKLSKKSVLENYDRIVKHLLSHITDPKEPIDPRDYSQAKNIITEIKKIKGGKKKGGVELYGYKHDPDYDIKY